jgi:hypothetical protein
MKGSELRFWGQGTWKDGTLCGWPDCKSIHPIANHSNHLGGYYNELVYFCDCAKAGKKIERAEGYRGVPCTVTAVHAPFATAAETFCASATKILEKEFSVTEDGGIVLCHDASLPANAYTVDTRDEQAIVLTAASFHPLTGWYDRSGTHTIVRGNPDSYDRSWTAHKRDSDTEWVCLFGFVPHGEQPPTFKAGVYDYRAPFDEEIDTSGYTLVGETYFDGEPITITPTPTIPVKGGMCYLTQLSVTYKTVDQNRYDVAVLCDRTGQWEKCKFWTSTSF